MKVQEMPTKEIKEYILANYFDGDENVDSVVDGDDEIITMANTVKALEKLAEYEELEEKGRLIKLPCKVGDKVLYYDVFDREINEKTVDAFCIDKGGIRVSLEGYPILQTADFRIPKEAEAALEKMRGE